MWDVFEGSEFLFLQFGPYYQTVLQRALHGFLELYVLLYPFWYVDIKDQLTEATNFDIQNETQKGAEYLYHKTCNKPALQVHFTTNYPFRPLKLYIPP